MRIQITLKTPDCLENAAEEYAQDCLGKESQEVLESYDHNEKYYLEDKRAEFVKLCEKWFSYGECLTVEIDTDREEIMVI